MHKNIFDDNYKKIIDSLENIKLSVDDFRQESAAKISEAQKDNPKIAKMLMDYIAGGYSVNEAIVIVALAFDTDLKRVRAVYDNHRITTAATAIYAKKYLIHTLINAGFKAPDIAIILGCTKQTVYNWYKQPFTF